MLVNFWIYALVFKGCISICFVSISDSAPVHSDSGRTGNYITSNEIQTREQAKAEQKYFRRRKKRLKRWDIDVDVSYTFVSE